MSILENILNGLSGNDSQSTDRDFTPPTALCRSDCGIAGEACPICQPYKEKLIDAVYNVEHIEEFQAKYEVVGTTAAESGTVKCPYCGGNSEDPYTCEFCGSKLQDGTGKIKVASAADIPDPVIEARDIIYDRHAAIAEKYGTDSDDSTLSEILSGIAGIFTGAGKNDDSDAETDSLGVRMSRDEIEQMAAHYGVSLAVYLKGLDNGTYLTMNQYKTAQTSTQNGSGASAAAGVAAGIGAAGIGAGIASLLSGRNNQNNPAGRPPMPPDGNHGKNGQRPGGGNMMPPEGASGRSDNMGGPGGGMGGPGGRPGGMGGPGGGRPGGAGQGSRNAGPSRHGK